MPTLLKLYNQIDSDHPFSENMLEAYITVLPKPGKPPTNPTHFRPISLLNVDLKLYSKILANRLNPILPHIIHTDQSGFVPMRKAKDNTVKEIFGYRTIQYREALCIVGYIFSLGFLWLVFYWKPQWNVWVCCAPCKLEYADVILLRTTDEFKQYTRKKVKWMCVSEMNSLTEISDHPITVDEKSIIYKAIKKPDFKIKCVWVQKMKYVWLNSEKKFEKIGALEDSYSCSDIHSRFGTGLTHEEQTLRRLVCGPNAIEVEIVPVWKLLFKEILNPFYLFQAASLSLWLAEGYIEYSILIIVITLISIALTVYDLRKQSVKLNRLVESNNSAMITVGTFNGDCNEVESRHLVPGDIIVLTGKKLFLPCDCILLRGSCIVNEGMLTGESIPVTKTPLDNVSNSVPWKIQSGEDYKRHVLFCGTEVIQTTSSDSGAVIAVVLNTGFNTAKGDMVRAILYPKPINFKLYQDGVRFLLCLIIIAVLGFIYSVTVLKLKGGTLRDILIKSFVGATVAIPPVLPAAMATAIMYAQKRLKKKGIFCLSPQRINICGRINLVCFDKTGTLTEDGLDLWGVVPSINNSFQKVHMFTNGNSLPWGPLLGALASCHSLIYLDEKVQGDPLDLKMFEGTNWVMLPSGGEASTSRNTLVIPGPKYNSPPVQGIHILQQFPFSSSLQRMSVVAQVVGSSDHLVYMKGAPEMVTQFCTPESVPTDFASELNLYTRQGFRVIGLASKTLDVNKHDDKASYTREEVESSLIFLGLLILENKLKPETIPALSELNSALLRTAMITGDNLQTAITVAKNCGIIQEHDRLILVEASEPNDKFPASISFKQMKKDMLETTVRRGSQSANENCIEVEQTTYHFAMTGKAYQVIVQYFYNLLPKLLLNGSIFARMSPGQKSNLIEEFQKMDYYVAMCGDGANDCGALKVAHAGISLSEQEASVASPFTSQTTNIQCVPQLIREGRAALVSSFAVFKYVTLYAMIQYICLMLLYWQVKTVGLYQYLIQDVGVTVLVCLTMSLNHAYPKLAPYRPPAQLISPPLLLSVIFNVLLNLAMQICSFVLVQQQPWYSTSNYRACAPANENITFSPNSTEGASNETQESSGYDSYETTTLWSITTISCIIVAFVFSKGKPFRKPIYTNYIFICLLPIQLAACLFILFADYDSVYKALQLVCTPTLWRISILIMLFIFFIVSFIVEEAIIENRKLWLYLKRLVKYYSKSQYRILYRKLQNDPIWPPVNDTQYADAAQIEVTNEVYCNEGFENDDF
ncbi:probable cation-transporting ATPase 13A4 [Bombina bombina]|uniref:probable cation-transporting ATPase 13A4 n=1 Tax=Bombina bombina TaxID=8345 RepID=UPI00235A9F92|nr:probable cation-transporting ATPase 13A4 [Bombina bombina]